MTINVGFANLASSGWTAGGHYLRNLFYALKRLPDPARPDITLLVTLGTSSESYQILTPFIDHVVQIPETKWQRYWKSIYLRLPIPDWLERLALPRRVLTSELRDNRVDVLFSNDEYGPSFPFPLISWIPDFQHIHLPEFFTASKIKTRDRHNVRIGRFAQRIMLSSQDAVRDLRQKIPQAVDKARVVSFVAQIPGEAYNAYPMAICDQYQLPKKFFYLPNQFWIHKNHTVVIEALSLLRSQCSDITVVCTGNPTEFRKKGYYSQLVSMIKERGLSDMMVLLGIVPHEHIFQFMRQSLYVLQPSLFEGWSTTIEEAKSLGKGVIASDLAVHREQNPSGSKYFPAKDPRALSLLLAGEFDNKQPGPDLKMEAEARDQLPLRTRNFADQFMRVVNEARELSD